ncbi:MMPL family transporter [Mycobacterium lepromatosis]|uniref:MMPL family transporter n=1 Tax=Mycobacterium lepromatosis TaxID=480418 RepID=UPI000678A680|nr:MMPL family transporter [Mycobacterium lepromatosis]
MPDFYTDPITSASVQNNYGKALAVSLLLTGNRGEPLVHESLDAVSKIVAYAPASPNIQTYVTGALSLITNMRHSGEASVVEISTASVIVIFAALLFVYRLSINVIALPFMVTV